jgi:hypothetical protein
MYANEIKVGQAISKAQPLLDNGPILIALDHQQNCLDDLGAAMASLESRLASILTFTGDDTATADENKAPSASVVHSKVESSNERIRLMAKHIQALSNRVTL